MNLRQIVARNVKALMDANPLLGSHAKLAARCSTPTRRIGARTIGHLLNPQSTVQPQLDTVNAIAEAFRVPAWMLLRADFDEILKRPLADVLTAEQIEVARRLSEVDRPHLDMLLALVSRPAPTPATTPPPAPGTLRPPAAAPRRARR
jgi:transcriptional regulator with XRE-family HTH domain